MGISPSELDVDRINSLDNVFTACQTVHTRFGKLQIWLEASPVQHTYMLRKARTNLSPNVMDGTIITLTTNTDIPLPDPSLLALHAACAKVAHMTQMTELVDQIAEDWECTAVLSEDGSSTDLLTRAFNTAVIVAH
ncbi:hypothetical protein BDV93DRAFT_498533 [Ceratobasidium sp. AG-I]|nr:hypothetical protein BDV93DRAFT_498533 [Ceratobasidium sp. AG-I]